jgi:hypothetical protein
LHALGRRGVQFAALVFGNDQNFTHDDLVDNGALRVDSDEPFAA